MDAIALIVVIAISVLAGILVGIILGIFMTAGVMKQSYVVLDKDVYAKMRSGGE